MATDPVTHADPDAPLAKRVDSIESEQKRQGGMLEQILAKVGGGGQAPAAPGGGQAPEPVSPAAMQGEIAAQVRREIQEADQRRASEQAETRWRDDVQKTLEQVKKERAPREPETGVRAFVQRLVVGRQG